MRLTESEKVPGCGSAEISRHFHKMGSFQWAYNDLLAKEGGFDPIPRAVQQLYERVHYERREYGPGKNSPFIIPEVLFEYISHI